jgi:hypothetical protein
MALQASGSIKFSDIATELSYSSTNFSFSNTAARQLAGTVGVPTNLGSFRNKSRNWHLTLQTASNGTTEWSYISHMKVGPDGCLYLLDRTYETTGGNVTACVYKLNTDGASIVWTRTISPATATSNFSPKNLDIDSSGNVYVVTYEWATRARGNIILVKLNSSGTLVWKKQYYTTTATASTNSYNASGTYSNGLQRIEGFSPRVAIDNSGNPVITTEQTNGRTYDNYAWGNDSWMSIIRINPSDGTILNNFAQRVKAPTDTTVSWNSVNPSLHFDATFSPQDIFFDSSNNGYVKSLIIPKDARYQDYFECITKFSTTAITRNTIFCNYGNGSTRMQLSSDESNFYIGIDGKVGKIGSALTGSSYTYTKTITQTAANGGVDLATNLLATKDNRFIQTREVRTNYESRLGPKILVFNSDGSLQYQFINTVTSTINNANMSSLGNGMPSPDYCSCIDSYNQVYTAVRLNDYNFSPTRRSYIISKVPIDNTRKGTITIGNYTVNFNTDTAYTIGTGPAIQAASLDCTSGNANQPQDPTLVSINTSLAYSVSDSTVGITNSGINSLAVKANI